MKQSTKVKALLKQLEGVSKLGDIRTIAKEIKKDHALALELWTSEKFMIRQLAILVMDHKLLTKEIIDQLVADIQKHPSSERTQLIDWLMANQLTKNKQTLAMMLSWEKDNSPLKRRLFWYYQGRLRWMGQTPPDSEVLLNSIEKNILNEEPEVQWAMNFTAGWIGVYEEKYRQRCISLGETTGLFKEQKVSKGCTPNYLPQFIAIEVEKRMK